MTHQATYNCLVAAFCDRPFFTRHHVSVRQIDDLQQRLEKLWFNPMFRKWITTYSHNDDAVNYSRVLAYFGFVIDHTYYLGAMKKSVIASHLWTHCLLLHHSRDVKSIHYSLRSSRNRVILEFCCNVGGI